SELSELSEKSELSELSELSEKSELSDNSDSSDNSDFSDNSDNSDNSDTPPSPAVIHLFSLDSLRPYTVGLDSVTIPIAGKGFLWISSSAFSNPDGLTIFMQALNQTRITAPT
ncbi:MAG: hypothetical protein K2K26_01040, partial [Muribaculaceae bacterium]|nr:hypothetical protein [Muribaculaceae bacterium]